MIEAKSELSIEALRAGNPEEFSKLVDLYSVPIYRLALKMTGIPTDAEDVLQNTFLKAFQHLKDFEGRSSLSTWLYRIASNEALMMLRKRRPELTLSDTVTDDSDNNDYSPTQFTDWCCLPEEEFLSKESRVARDTTHRFCSARYRRPIHPGNQRSAQLERGGCQDPLAACTFALARRTQHILW
jgi:RNA polymerase sigma factor (sigma-70 family)